MAGADKILVVVILVLSCVFLYTAVSVFGGDQKELKEKEDLRDERDKYKSENESLKTTGEAGTYIRLEETIKGLSDVTSCLNDVKGSLKGIDGKVDKIDKSADKRIGELGTSVKTLVGSITTLSSATIPALTKQLDRINTKILEQAKNISDLEDNVKKLEGDIARSEEKYAAELRKKDKEIQRLKDIVAGPGEDGRDGKLPPPPPDVVCTILNVVRDRDTTMVLLDKGSKDGLSVGHELFVYNAVERYKGIIKVYKMEGEDRCIATIVREAGGKKIAENDKAAVKTWKTD